MVSVRENFQDIYIYIYNTDIYFSWIDTYAMNRNKSYIFIAVFHHGPQAIQLKLDTSGIYVFVGVWFQVQFWFHHIYG